MKYGTVIASSNWPIRIRILGEPRGIMVYVGRWACRYSWSRHGRFSNGSRWTSGWHDTTTQPDC